MPQKVTDAQIDSAIAQHGTIVAAAKALGIRRQSLNERLRDRIERPRPKPEFTVADLPDCDLPVEELVKYRKRQFEQKRKHEETHKLITVTVNIPGPVAILHFGDPHVDDDGTDIALLEKHAKLTRDTEGLWGANVGDTTNNWVGRLAKLYAEQGTTSKQSWMLAEWFINSARWLYMVGGNHDAWSGSGDPLHWISRQAGALYKSSEVRVELKFPDGRAARVNCRHDFSGHSQYNAAHGATKAAIFGVRDHLYVNGHKHTSGYNVLKDPGDGFAMHLVQIASYKVYDRYAKDRGFRDLHLGPACMTIFNTRLDANHPDFIKVYWDPLEGVDILKYLRRKK